MSDYNSVPFKPVKKVRVTYRHLGPFKPFKKIQTDSSFDLALGIVILIMLFVASYACSQDRPAIVPVPDLEGETNWGYIKQDGLNLIISGHPQWIATGKICKDKDRTVIIQWVEIETGRAGPGVYKMVGKDLVGEWGWSPDTWVNPNNAIGGDSRADRIFKVLGEVK